MINYVIALVMFCGLTTAAYGEYYKYEDANGNVIFTDNPSNIPEDQRYEMKTVMEPKRNKKTIAENDLPDRRKVECPKCGMVSTIDVLLEDQWKKQNKETVAEKDLPDRRKVKCPKCGAALFTIDEGLEDQWKKQKEERNKRFMEFMKKEYNAKESCPTESKQQVEQAIRSTWTGMAQAMLSGNREKAFSFFSVFSRDEMKRRMSGKKQEELSKIFSNFKGIEIESLYEGIAECGVLRQDGSETYSYPARFGRDPDCEWRIRGF